MTSLMGNSGSKKCQLYEPSMKPKRKNGNKWQTLLRVRVVFSEDQFHGGERCTTSDFVSALPDKNSMSN